MIKRALGAADELPLDLVWHREPSAPNLPAQNACSFGFFSLTPADDIRRRSGCKLAWPNAFIWRSHSLAKPDTCLAAILQDELNTRVFHCPL